MTENPRPSRQQAVKYVVDYAPEYADILKDIQAEGGRYNLPQKLVTIRDNLKVTNYVELYDSDSKTNHFFMIGVMGEASYENWINEVKHLPPESHQAQLDELLSAGSEIADLEVESEYTEDDFEKLSEGKKAAVMRQAQFFFMGYLAHFHNILSVMVHAEKLTSLVPKAIAGDDAAYLKAIQVDHSLLRHHPYFRDRYDRASNRGESDFLSKIAYRQSNPTLRSRIRYPALYVVFAFLETVGWLEDITHNEILDICDQANLDRYQSRIEDVTYLTKRLREYRRMQRTGGVSMH